jgi:hypothetical protein
LSRSCGARIFTFTGTPRRPSPGFSGYAARVPTHPLWANPVFAPDDYQMFTKDVELSLLEIEEPEEIQIRKTLPAVAERLNTLHQGLARDVAEWDAKTNKRLDAIDARLNDLFEVALLWCLTQCEQPVRPVATITATTTATAVFTPVSTMTSFHSVRTSPVPSERISPSVDASFSALIDKNDNEPPPYLLSRSISTVPQPWKEWTIGINGGLSVQRLEDLYGPRWRLKHSEKMMYGRRKIIRNSTTADGRDQRRRGGGRTWVDATTRSVVFVATVSTAEQTEEK